MGKIVLLSILFMTIAVPVHAAREPDPVRGLAKTMWRMAVFTLLYWLGVMFLTPMV